MKTIKGVFIVLFFLITTGIFAQSTEVIYIRIQEGIGNAMLGSYMSIAFPDNTSEKIDLERVGPNGKKAEINGEVIRKKLNELTDKGFEITSCSVGADFNLSTTIIIMTRKD